MCRGDGGGIRDDSHAQIIYAIAAIIIGSNSGA